MKSAFCIVFCSAILLLACRQQKGTGFTITGDIKGLDKPFIYLKQPQGDSIITDSVAVKNGKFQFKGQVSDPVVATLSSGDQEVQFFLENADIHIEGTYDSMEKATITGSATQKTSDSLRASLGDIQAQIEQLSQPDNNSQETDTTAQIETSKKIDALNNQLNGQIYGFIQSHPQNILSLYLLEEMSNDDSAADKVLELLAGLEDKLQNSSKGREIKKSIEARKLTDVGRKAMDFTQNDLDGQPVRFDDFRKGKYVLLDFWASWCGPCRQEIPNLITAYNKHKQKNFAVLAVSLDTHKEEWKKAVLDENMPWKQISDLKEKNEVAGLYGVVRIPSNFLIDPAGNIIARDLMGPDLQKKLDELLH